MRFELRKLATDIDQAIARLNAGLSGIALMLSIVLGAGLSGHLGEIFVAAGLQGAVPLLLGP